MLNKKPSLTRRQAIYRSLVGVFLYISVSSARAVVYLRDASGGEPRPIEISPSLPARVPDFQAPTATADGFTVKVSNYDTNWNWSVNATRGSATRSAGLITVTGLAPGESAVVTVGATRTGYNAGTAVVSGTAAAAVAVPSLPVWGVAALSGMLMILVKKLNKK